MTASVPVALLGDILQNFDSRRVPLSARERELRRGRYPYYGAAGIIDHVDAPIFSGLHLLVGEDGTVETDRGTPFVQLASGEFWVNNHAHVLRGSDDVETRYAYYALQLVPVRPWITGAVQPKLTQGNLNKIEVAYPEREVRERIVGLLGALDDKIELNRRTNETLEAMARALFKSWFVDFDPVRAKAEGRAPVGMDAATAALFPSAFSDGVPKGWKTIRLGDAVEVNPPRPLPRGTVAPYLEMRNVPTVGHLAKIWERREAGSGARFENGDTLLARITPCLENGKTAFVDFLASTEVGWGSTEFIVLRPKSPLPPYFGYLLARDEALRAHAIQSMTGTTGRQRVPAEAVARFPMVMPTPDVAQALGRLLEEPLRLAKVNHDESRTLAELRDLLLPKLLSGELRVRDAEKIVGQVA